MRETAAAAPSNAATSRGKNKRMRVGDGDGGRINTCPSMGEREERSEYIDVANQSDDEDVDGEFNLSAAEDDGYDDEGDDVDDDKEAELTR